MDLVFLFLATLCLFPAFYEIHKLYLLKQSRDEWGFLTEEEEERRKKHLWRFAVWCGVSVCFSLLAVKYLLK